MGISPPGNVLNGIEITGIGYYKVLLQETDLYFGLYFECHKHREWSLFHIPSTIINYDYVAN